MDYEEIYKKETGKDARYEYWEGGDYGYYIKRLSENYVDWLEEKLEAAQKKLNRVA